MAKRITWANRLIARPKRTESPARIDGHHPFWIDRQTKHAPPARTQAAPLGVGAALKLLDTPDTAETESLRIAPWFTTKGS